MKVLHIFNEINFSGAELMLNDASSYMQSKGIELYAISTGEKFGNFTKNFEKSGIKTYHKHYISNVVLTISGIKFYWFLYKFLKEKKIDVVHIHKSSIYFAAIIAWVLNIPCVKTAHNVFANRAITRPIAILRRIIIRKVFNATFHTIGDSVYENELYYYKNPSVKINNWYNDSRFYPHELGERELNRSKLQIDQDKFVIISIGGCSAVKNHHDILRAMKLLEGKLDIVYLHLGQGITECEEKELAKTLGLNTQVHFLGNMSNVREYLIASDVYIMPSKFEGLGNACLEAMACAIPVILYNVVGLKDLIRNDDNGFLIESKPKELAAKILLYAENKNIADSKAQKALSFVKENFSLKHNVDLMIKLYEN